MVLTYPLLSSEYTKLLREQKRPVLSVSEKKKKMKKEKHILAWTRKRIVNTPGSAISGWTTKENKYSMLRVPPVA